MGWEIGAYAMTLSRRILNRLASVDITPQLLPHMTLREVTRIPGISTKGFAEIAMYVQTTAR